MNRSARLQMLLSMLIFGTIGLLVKYTPLPSAAIALLRGAIGLVFLLLVMAVKHQTVSPAAIKANLLILILSGIALGGNWMLLFEAYQYTTVATATLCYYLAPVFVVLLSPVFYKEKLTGRKLLCTLVALIGMVLVSGVLEAGFHISQLTGVLYGLAAAVLYATVVLLNKALRNISALERTVAQLLISSVVLLPYVLFTTPEGAFRLAPLALVFMLVLGIVHTGVAYSLYFHAVGVLPAQTAALLSYLDPVLAVLLSALLLREPMGWSVGIGAVLILGSTLVSELGSKSK